MPRRLVSLISLKLEERRFEIIKSLSIYYSVMITLFYIIYFVLV